MNIAIIIFVLFFIFYVLCKIYLKSFTDVVRTFKLLKKALDTRDLLLLKILPDVKNEEEKSKIMSMIEERNSKFKISYNDAILADASLNNELKKVYEEINEMKKNKLQDEIFKRIVIIEKKIKNLRREYSKNANEFNVDLTIHVNVLVKILHLKPLDTY